MAWFDFEDEIAAWLNEALHLYSLEPALEGASWGDVILHLVPSWNEKGAKLDPLNWAPKQVSDPDEIKKVPSWNQKGVKLLHKKTSYLIRMLLLMLIPVPLAQLMKWMEYKKKQTFRDNYLLPLQSVGFVTMTKPDQPNARDQKYVITEKGKRFLGGRMEP